MHDVQDYAALAWPYLDVLRCPSTKGVLEDIIVQRLELLVGHPPKIVEEREAPRVVV